MKRPPLHTNDRGICYINDADHPDRLRKLWIDDNDQVTLKLDTDGVHVVKVEKLANGRYRGRVESFEHSGEDVLEGVAIGELIEFEQRHVFGCFAG